MPKFILLSAALIVLLSDRGTAADRISKHDCLDAYVDLNMMSDSVAKLNRARQIMRDCERDLRSDKRERLRARLQDLENRFGTGAQAQSTFKDRPGSEPPSRGATPFPTEARGTSQSGSSSRQAGGQPRPQPNTSSQTPRQNPITSSGSNPNSRTNQFNQSHSFFEEMKNTRANLRPTPKPTEQQERPTTGQGQSQPRPQPQPGSSFQHQRPSAPSSQNASSGIGQQRPGPTSWRPSPASSQDTNSRQERPQPQAAPQSGNRSFNGSASTEGNSAPKPQGAAFPTPNNRQDSRPEEQEPNADFIRKGRENLRPTRGNPYGDQGTSEKGAASPTPEEIFRNARANLRPINKPKGHANNPQDDNKPSTSIPQPSMEQRDQANSEQTEKRNEGLNEDRRTNKLSSSASQDPSKLNFPFTRPRKSMPKRSHSAQPNDTMPSPASSRSQSAQSSSVPPVSNLRPQDRGPEAEPQDFAESIRNAKLKPIPSPAFRSKVPSNPFMEQFGATVDAKKPAYASNSEDSGSEWENEDEEDLHGTHSSASSQPEKIDPEAEPRYRAHQPRNREDTPSSASARHEDRASPTTILNERMQARRRAMNLDSSDDERSDSDEEEEG